MAGRRIILVPKKEEETCTFNFDFTANLASTETILSQAVTASVYTGIDPAPSAILSGVGGISGNVVSQNITAGVVGVIYQLLCTATTSLSQILEISAYCAVITDLP